MHTKKSKLFYVQCGVHVCVCVGGGGGEDPHRLTKPFVHLVVWLCACVCGCGWEPACPPIKGYTLCCVSV